MKSSKPAGSHRIAARIHELLKADGIGQLLRYGAVGACINGALYVSYLLLVFIGVEPKMAMSVVYMIGLIVGFYSHRKLTFSHNENAKRAIVRYLSAHLGGYAINFLLLLVFVDLLGFRHTLVQASAVFVVAAYLFIIFKYWVFSEKNYVAS